MKLRAWIRVGLLVSLAALPSMASAIDVPIPLRLYFNRPDSKTKFIAKGTFPLPDANTDDPRVEGGAITFRQGALSETISLPALNWSALGSPPGAKGFKYTDPTGATCRKLRVTAGVIKGRCKPTAPGAPPFDAGSDAPIEIVLSIGTATQRYCAECPNGGEQKGNPQQLTKLINCLAPVMCPAEAVPTPTATATTAPTATATSTASATPTETPFTDEVCCDFASGCSSASSHFVCVKLTGGTGFFDTVCDVSGNCVAPPGTPGGCCEGQLEFGQVCTMGVDQATCESAGATFHPNAVCLPNATCADQ